LGNQTPVQSVWLLRNICNPFFSSYFSYLIILNIY
jgi:hypothetical protein